MTPHYVDDWLSLHVGDCRAVLAELEADSIDCVITSPPYFGLRDYGIPAVRWPDGWEGTLGLEPTPTLYVDHLVAVFREVRRVLRPTGTVWLNIGDSYAGTLERGSAYTARTKSKWQHGLVRADASGNWTEAGVARRTGLKPKDRMLMPARVAVALQDDGWWVRDEIVWHKPNPMPSSVEDRTTPAHEMVYLLSKRARYWSDFDAIREAGSTTRPELLEFGPRPDRGHPGHSNDRRRIKVPGGWEVDPGAHGTVHRKGRTSATYRDKTAENARGLRQAPEPGEPGAFHPLGRNKRSVWTIATQPYPEAHFATFPEALVDPMIRAGCPEGGVVLDPFAGSGTTALVANRLGRRAVLIELSEEYGAQAIARIARARAEGDGPAIDMPVPFAPDGLWAEAAG